MGALIKESNYIGVRFGTITPFSVEKIKGRWFVNCRCECGAIGKVRTDSINSGHTSSCAKFVNYYEDINHEIKKVFTHSWESFIINSGDYERIPNKSFWLSTTGDGYFFTVIKGKSVAVHRFVMDATDKNIFVDHKNMDTMDNTKSNLRFADRSLNSHNRKTLSDKTSKYKGVSFENKNRKKWVSSIRKNGKLHSKIFLLEIDAAEYFDIKAIELYGKDAITNKSLGLI